MRSAVVTAAFVAVLCGVGALGRRPPPSPRITGARAGGSAAPRIALCPAGTLPDQGVCVPVPRPLSTASSEHGIPKRPDRPADYQRYRLPVDPSTSPSVLPTAALDAGLAKMGVSIAAPAGTPVSVPTLEDQIGPSEVVLTGKLVGDSLVTHHRTRSSGRERDYVLVLGNLDAVREFAQKSAVDPNAPVAKVGSVPVYFEVRLLRSGVDPFAVPAERLLDDAETVAVDPRNVLRLRN